MPIESTEIWEEQTSNMLWVGPNLPISWQAKRGWMVSGTNDDAAARTATPLDGRPIAQIGQSHPLDARLICTELPVEPYKGPLVKKVTAVYKIPDGTLDDSDPLKAKPIIRKHIGTISLPADLDADGHPILNSAKDPLDPPPQRTVAVLQMNIQVNAPLFVISKGILYTDAVNSDRFEVIGAGFVDPGMCHCVGFSSVSGSRQGQSYETINVDFEFADLLTIGQATWSIFDLRIPDVGYNGFCASGKGPITFKGGVDKGKRVPIPIALNGYGAPYTGSEYGIGKNALAGVNSGTPAGATRLDAGNAIFLGYKMKTRRPFAGLL